APSREMGESLQDVALDRLRVPVLVVHHREDACRASRYADTSWAMRRLSAAPRKALLTFSGGQGPQSEACEPLAPHGYLRLGDKGSYPGTLNAAIAAYRAKQPPHIVQVYEVGTQTMLSSGAVYPVHQLVKDHGVSIDWNDVIGPVKSYYSSGGNLYSMAFNSSTPVLFYNKDLFKKAGLADKPPPTCDEVEAAARKLVASGA